MHPLSQSELLRIWEHTIGRGHVAAALNVLAAVRPELGASALVGMSVGERDAHLLALYAWAFGPQIACVTDCPACAGLLELELDAEELLAAAPAQPAEPLRVVEGDFVALARPADSRDIFAAARSPDLTTARDVLLARCVSVAAGDGAPVRLEEAPPELIAAVERALDRADPLANVEVELRCPACSWRWATTFDIVALLLPALDAWAQRVLGEVHTLAAAYGWREADILALSPRRREAYLAMVGI